MKENIHMALSLCLSILSLVATKEDISRTATRIQASTHLTLLVNNGKAAQHSRTAMTALSPMIACGKHKTKLAQEDPVNKDLRGQPLMSSSIRLSNVKMTCMSVSTKKLHQEIEHSGLHQLTHLRQFQPITSAISNGQEVSLVSIINSHTTRWLL